MMEHGIHASTEMNFIELLKKVRKTRRVYIIRNMYKIENIFFKN